MKPTESSDPEASGNSWRDLEALFERCLEVPGRDRARFLLDHCRTDEALLARALDLLLAAHEADDLRTPDWRPEPAAGAEAGATPDPAPPPPAPEDPLGLAGFRVLETLGEGGMGTVYLAEQLHPVRRRVALKVARAPLGRHGRARLAAERQAMARLSHPNVAQIYEAGSTADGHPYFAMEWIEGAPITAACDARRLGVDERLRLFLDACAGVQHAHQKGILHRDLKPSNVMVTETEGRLTAKIIDFGVAQAFDETLAAGTTLGQEGLLGTPAYMSPETLLADPDDRRLGPDTRSDVYSLGVLLFELLVGERPVPRRTGETPLHYLRRVAETEVVSPLRRWRDLEPAVCGGRAAVRGSSPRALDRHLRGDLEWIVLKAVAPDREVRYASVSELAADLRRHLAHEPVLAGPPSAAYRLRKLGRRHRAAVVSAALVFLALVAGLVARSFEAARANRQAAEARLARDESDRVVELLRGLFEGADPVGSDGEDLRARDLLRRGTELLTAGKLDASPRVRSRLLTEVARVHTSLGDPPQALRLAELALELRERDPAADAAAVAESLYQVGSLAFRLGEYGRSEALLRRALAERERLYGPSSREAVDVLADLGLVYSETFRYEEAAQLYRRAFALYEARGESRTREAANVLSNLGVVAWRLGRHDEAESFHRRALDVRGELFPPTHPAVALSWQHLADVYLSAGRFSEAETAFAEALVRFERIYGPDHPDVGRTVNNQAGLFLRMGRWQEAETAYRRVLEIHETTFGHRHIGVVYALYNLGQNLTAQGRYEEALPLLREALAIEEGLDPAGLGTSLSRVAVAQALHPLGRLDEAEELLEHARTRLAGAPGEEEEQIHREALLELGRVALAGGRIEAARSWFEDALEHGAAVTGEDTSRGPALLGLAEIERAGGGDDRARELLQAALVALGESYPDNHVTALRARRLAAELGLAAGS